MKKDKVIEMVDNMPEKERNKLAKLASENPVEFVPDMNSPEWTPWVLSHLNDNEKFNGNPTVGGLKRLVQKLVGPIVDMQSTLGQCYALYREGKHVGFHANVAVRIGVKFDLYSGSEVRYFSGVADKNPNNQGQDFNCHATACAETAAFGRAYKHALNLVGVLAAEEVQGSNQGLALESPDEVANDAQFAAMNTVGKKTNINIVKLIAQLSREEGVKFISLSNMPRNFAAYVVKVLNNYQRDLSSIPDDLMGFDARWKPQS